MPKEFAISWFKKANKDFSNSGEVLMEFQVILNKLKLTYTISDTDLELKFEPENKGKSQNEKTTLLTNSKPPRKAHSIPSIENFPEFKKWLLNKLNELEKYM